MRKLLVPLAGLAALSVVLGACNANLGTNAARVDGTAISQQHLTATLAAISSDADYRCVLSSAGGQLKAGAGQGAYATSFADSILTTLIEEKALAKAVDEQHLAVTPFALSVARTGLEAQLSPPQGSACTASGSTVLGGLSPAYRDFLVALQAEQVTLLADKAGVKLTKPEMAAYASAHPTTTSLSCVSAIEVTSKSEALALARQVRAGASFAGLAKAHSIDQGSAASGGALGCVLPSQLTAPLNSVVAGLSPGQVSAPIAFGTNYVIFQVTSRSPASAEQVASVVLQSEASKDSAVVVSALGGVSVWVDPAFGTWAKATGVWQVVPPTGPPAGLLEHPGAVTPTSANPSNPLG